MENSKIEQINWADMVDTPDTVPTVVEETVEFTTVEKKHRQGPRGQRLQKRADQNQKDSKDRPDRPVRPQRDGPSYRDLVYKLTNLENRIHSPKVDLVEDHDTYVVKMELPGVELDDISIKLKDSQFLLVSASKQEEYTDESQDSQGHQIVYKESKYGSITRRVKLPTSVRKFVSSFDNGVLRIVCDKQDVTVKYQRKER